MTTKTSATTHTDMGHKGMFKHSFKDIDLRFLWIILLDIAFFVILYIAYALFMNKIVAMTPQISDVNDLGGQLQAGNLFLSQQTLSSMADIYYKTIAYSVILFLFIVAVWTLIKYRVYTFIDEKPLKHRVYWRFALLSLLWFAIFSGLFYSLSFIVSLIFGDALKTSVFAKIVGGGMILFGISYLFFLTIFWITLLLRTEKIKKTCKQFFTVAIRNSDHTLLPMVFMILVFGGINVVFFLIGRLPKTAFMIIATIITLVFLTWMRFYCTAVSNKILDSHPAGMKDAKKAKKKR